MTIEYRFAPLEVRAADGGKIEGVAMPYGREADIAGIFRESVTAGAFGTIGDVILNRMHDRAEPLARTDGGGLELEDGAERLWLRADIPDYRADVRDMVKRRILRGFSVEMEVTAEDWPSPDKRIIRAATLWGVGLVDRPAYDEATAAIAKRAKEACRAHPRHLADSRLSGLRRWALRNVIVADGPRAGRPFRIASPPWGEVIDAMDDSTLEQVTIRGSVQSGKTASLIAAALGHMAFGRSVLIFEPDDKLKRALAARILAWGRLCKDEAIQAAYEPKRPPFARTADTGGRLEVISARETGAGVMRTAEVVIVDELRLFHMDLLGDLVDRMAAYGGKGRLITASSAGYEHECKTTHELDKSDSRRWFLHCPACDRENVADWKNVDYKARRYPFYVMPCCGAALEGIPFRRAVEAGRWKPTKDEMVPGTRGYHLDAFTSPFESLRTIVRQWKRADAHRKQTGSMAEIISFQTGRLAIPYKPEAAQGVTPEGIRSSCRENYDPAIVPAGAVRPDRGRRRSG